MDRADIVDGIVPVADVTRARAVYASVGQEQHEIFERMLDHGPPVSAESVAERVTTLTHAEIEQIEDRLPDGATVASIVGHPLEYDSPSESRRGRHHRPDGEHRVDADA